MLSKKRAAAIAARFGKPPDNRYEDEDFRCIRSYYDYRREKEPETFVALRTKCKKFAHKTQKGEESDSSGILAFFAYYYEMLRSRLV